MTATVEVPRAHGAARLAVVGKGGSGKTATVAMLARVLAERGRDVLAVDLDTNPGLTLSLGLAPDAGRLPDDAVEERDDTTYGFGLSGSIAPADAVAAHAAVVEDRIRVLGFGDVDRADNDVARRVDAVVHVFARFDAPGWVVVGDVEPGPARPFEGFTRAAELCIVLAEATRASCSSAERILSVLDHDAVPAVVVVSQSRSPGDADVVARLLSGREIAGSIPFDPAVAAAERRGSLLDLDAASPAIEAVRSVLDRLTRDREVVTR